MLRLEASWHQELEEEIRKPYIAELKKFLSEERQGNRCVYPPEDLVFNAFLHTPFSKVKVVLIGQDPYHGPGQAHGLSFSVPQGVPFPPSLRNVFQELSTDLNTSTPSDGCLLSWAKQGVLLLNATLTVRAKEPRSHYGRGWERFTDAVVARLWERKDPLVFLLWGKSAQEKMALYSKPFEGDGSGRASNAVDHLTPQCVPNPLEDLQINCHPFPHLVLTAAHPSPYSAHSGFFGCRHFSKTNDFLIRCGKTPIDW